MKIQLKEVKSYKTSAESADKHFNERFLEIKEMTKLLGMNNLSDEELAKLASKFYDIKLNANDGLWLAKAKLKSGNLVMKRIKTAITSQIDGRQLVLDATVYCKSDADISSDSIYTEESLQELVQNGVVVINDFGGWMSQGIAVEDYNQELARFGALIDVSLQNLGGFTDIIMRDFRKKLSPEQVASDSKVMADMLRAELSDYRSLMDDQRKFLAQKYHEARAEVNACDVLKTQLAFMGYGELGAQMVEEVHPALNEEFGVTPSSR